MIRSAFASARASTLVARPSLLKAAFVARLKSAKSAPSMIAPLIMPVASAWRSCSAAWWSIAQALCTIGCTGWYRPGDPARRRAALQESSKSRDRSRDPLVTTVVPLMVPTSRLS